ncbi:MAG: diguanylate cyclase [Burkholderiales bacterium]|nr:diguanylate cyclase [Burkholderiales bacterium]
MSTSSDPVATLALPLPAPGSEPAWTAWGALLAAAGLGVAVKEAASGRYLHANEVLLSWIGRDASDVLGRTDGDLFDAAAHSALRAADQTALAQGGVLAAEHRISMGGRVRDLALCRLADGAQAGGPDRLISIWTDLAGRRQQESQARAALTQIEQLQSANEALRRELADQAMRDPASGLYARAHFEDQLRREVDLSSREHREFSIVFVEIDEQVAGDVAAGADEAAPAAAFRGAPAVQAVQAALGRLLRGGTRAMDAACRLDERRFAVLLSGVGLATAHSRMESLRRRCATEIVVQAGEETRFTVSMGVASFPHTAHTQAELVEACTAALRGAQRRGGNHVALAAIRFEPA